MNKVKAFFDATGAFFLWCWKYPTTPIENFQDARCKYRFQTDPELFNELRELIREHDTKEKNNRNTL